jgi:hypothetical protein
MQGLWYSICKFCSQKFNLLVFLIGIADHVGPLVNMHRTEWRKERKEAKSHTQAQNKSRCKTEVFYGPFLPIWYCINLSLRYLDAVCSTAIGVLFVWIPCGIPYVKTTRWHTWHQEGCCKLIIMLNLVAAHIIHLILEIDFYLYSHKWSYFAGFQISYRCFHIRYKACPGDVVRVHS